MKIIAILLILGCGAPAGAQTIEGLETRNCVKFTSNGRLHHGQSFRAPLSPGFELSLGSEAEYGWGISVRRAGGKCHDYMWVVSPPFETGRAHVTIGPGYGLQARDSVRFARELRFVLNDVDYETALKMIRFESTVPVEDLLQEFQRLGKGTLTLKVNAFGITALADSPEFKNETLDWIEFSGEACVPR